MLASHLISSCTVGPQTNLVRPPNVLDSFSAKAIALIGWTALLDDSRETFSIIVRDKSTFHRGWINTLQDGQTNATALSPKSTESKY
jgi:hypothetical protein